MSAWIKSVYNNIIYLLFWIILSILITLALFQLHATLIALTLIIIDIPSLRPTGWSITTIYGLSRALWLILGMFWLGWVTFTEGYLREDIYLLKQRTIRLLIIIGSIYLGSYLILLLLR